MDSFIIEHFAEMDSLEISLTRTFLVIYDQLDLVYKMNDAYVIHYNQGGYCYEHDLEMVWGRQ